jgi:anhydro-N-acetylmuramic acid kinase
MAARWFAEPVRQWIVVGGGARNPTIISMLRKRLDAPVTTGMAIGWSGDHVEAQAFGYLAVRALRDLPLTFPTTTGVAEAMSGGVLAKAVQT